MNRLLIILLLVGAQDTLRVKVSLVTVGVRVTDWIGRDARGLKMENFLVFDDEIPQKIEFFSNEEQPITLGILLDRSFSMSYNAKLDRAKDAARALVGAAREGSQYFYIAFDDNVKLSADLTDDRHQVETAIDQTTLGGGTALYDAVLKGLALSAQAARPRQVLIIISDGADQHSTHRLPEIVRAVREAELQVFTIGYFSPQEEAFVRRSPDKLTLTDGTVVDNPQYVLKKLASESGAESFFPRSDKELSEAVEKVTKDLRTQYTLGFYPSSDDDNHYHQLRVAVRGGRFKVRARPGYSTSVSN